MFFNLYLLEPIDFVPACNFFTDIVSVSVKDNQVLQPFPSAQRRDLSCPGSLRLRGVPACFFITGSVTVLQSQVYTLMDMAKENGHREFYHPSVLVLSS